jgi:hypothetical protein
MTNGNGNGHRRPGDEPDDWTPDSYSMSRLNTLPYSRYQRAIRRNLP